MTLINYQTLNCIAESNCRATKFQFFSHEIIASFSRIIIMDNFLNNAHNIPLIVGDQMWNAIEFGTSLIPSRSSFYRLQHMLYRVHCSENCVW